MSVVIVPSHRGGSGGREFASPVMSRRPRRRCGLQRDPVGHQAWPASPSVHRQRQKRTSGTLGPRWAVGTEPDQFHRAGPSRLDARRAPLPDRASQHTDDQDGGRKLLWMLHCDLRDGPRISCPAKEPALAGSLCIYWKSRAHRCCCPSPFVDGTAPTGSAAAASQAQG